MKRALGLAWVLVSCTPAAREPSQQPVAVDMPSAHEVVDHAAPERAPKSKGAFLSALPFKHAKVQNAKVGAEAVKMAAELQLADAGSGRCPSVRELVDSKKLDPKSKDDPWGNPYRIVCEEGDAHAVSNGRDGVDGTADDIRDDATDDDLKRISDL